MKASGFDEFLERLGPTLTVLLGVLLLGAVFLVVKLTRGKRSGDEPFRD